MEDEIEQFECPGCKSLFSAGTASCPSCGMAFEWDEKETEEALDELIKQVDEAKSAPYDPSPGSEVVGASIPDEVEEPTHDPSQGSEEEYISGPLEDARVRKRALSMLGMAFAVLTVVSVIGLMVVLNYDTWINGAEENNIGDTQMMYVYLAVAAVIVCLLVVVFDFARNREAA